MNINEFNKYGIKRSGILNNLDLIFFLFKRVIKTITFYKVMNLIKFIIYRITGLKSGFKPYFFLGDIKNGCNLNCAMCFVKQVNLKHEKNYNITLEEYDKVLRDVKKHNIFVMLGCLYEPFVSENIYEIINKIKKHNMLCFVTTNFVDVDVKKLIDSGVDYIQVSLSGWDEKSYLKYTGKEYFKKVISNLYRIHFYKKKRNIDFPYVQVKYVLQKGNTDVENVIKLRDILMETGVNKFSLKKYQCVVNNEYNENIFPENPEYKQKISGFEMLNNKKEKRNGSMFYIGPDRIICSNEAFYIMKTLEDQEKNL